MTQLNHTQVWDEKFTVCKLPPPKTKTESSFCFLLLGIFKLENFDLSIFNEIKDKKKSIDKSFGCEVTMYSLTPYA